MLLLGEPGLHHDPPTFELILSVMGSIVSLFSFILFLTPIDKYLRNVHTYKGEGEYIGRPTKWGNPYGVKTYGRAKAIALFKDHLLKSDLIKDIGELENKALICSCYPLHCHGDVLIQEIYKNAI